MLNALAYLLENSLLRRLVQFWRITLLFLLFSCSFLSLSDPLVQKVLEFLCLSIILAEYATLDTLWVVWLGFLAFYIFHNVTKVCILNSFHLLLSHLIDLRRFSDWMWRQFCSWDVVSIGIKADRPSKAFSFDCLLIKQPFFLLDKQKLNNMFSNIVHSFVSTFNGRLFQLQIILFSLFIVFPLNFIKILIKEK